MSGPSLPYQSRTSRRFSAASVLLGYHPVVRRRIQPGFRGGVSSVRAERETRARIPPWAKYRVASAVRG